MFERFKSRWVLAGVVLVILGLASVACVQMAPRLLPTLSLSPQTPALSTADDIPVQVNPNPTVAVQPTLGAGQAAVSVGSISDTLTLNGRVAGKDEAVVSFTASGTVSAVDAKLGDSVHVGDVLVETDVQDTRHQLAQAQGELETAALRYEQAQAQAAADSASAQHDAAQTARDSASQRQSVVDDAQAALHRAQTNLQKVQAGPSDSDVRAAQAAVNTAQLALQKAQADLAKVQSGPDKSAVNVAQAQVDIAQSDYDKQSASLDALTRGPDPNAMRSAQRDVDLATAGVKAAQAIPIDPKDPHADKARADKDVQIATAQAALASAQDRFAALQQPPNSADVAVARSNAQAAKTKLDAAKQALAVAQAGPDQTAVSQAQSTVDNAQLAEQNAEDHLNDVMGHPTPQEVQAAQDQVNAAQAALQRATQVGTSVGGGSTGNSNVGTSYNIVLLEKEVARDQAMVDSLTHDLANTQVTAPFDGVVTRVQVRVGDKLTRDAPLMTIAHPGAAIVAVDPGNADASRIAVGQSVGVTFAGAPDPISGRVAAIKDAPSGQNTKSVQIDMDWGASQVAPYGAVGQVQIQVNQKNGVLVVPKKAIHSAGSRKYVQVQTPSGRKIVTVEIGIVSSDSAEITSGLTQGQIVFVGP